MGQNFKPRWFEQRSLGLAVVVFAATLAVGCKKSPSRAEAAPLAPTASSSPVGAASTTPPGARPGEPRVLGIGSASGAELRRFYHLAEGSEFVPYCALEVFAKEHGRTVEQHFEHYNLIPDAKSETNPLGLPIGITVSSDRVRLVGFNCAACHVGRITAKNSINVVVGGPASFNIRQFYDDLIPWLSNIQNDKKGLAEVAQCLLRGSVTSVATKQEPSAAEAAQDPQVAALRGASLSDRINRARALLSARLQSLDVVKGVGEVKPTTLPGPGRVDAFMTALNLLNQGANLPMNSPVAFPQLWNISKLKWLHWDNNTNATLQRNMGQAVGVGALLASDRGDPKKVLGTTLKVSALLELETIVKKLEPPRWPFEASPRERVSAGEPIFKAKCARCHEANADGSMPEALPEDDVGTDPFRIKNFDRKLHDKSLIDVLAEQLAAIERASNPPKRDPDPKWIATGKYGARSLQGVWATAPYLHNNSVPTLSDLLKPPAERPSKFALDYAQYDTEHVGFSLASTPSDTSPAFDTTQDGNGNGGHTYGVELSAEEKLSLIAYLKSL